MYSQENERQVPPISYLSDIVGFVRGDDPIFDQPKAVIGPHHFTPFEVMRWQAEDNGAEIGPRVFFGLSIREPFKNMAHFAVDMFIVSGQILKNVLKFVCHCLPSKKMFGIRGESGTIKIFVIRVQNNMRTIR
jgi:hypothetical protein